MKDPWLKTIIFGVRCLFLGKYVYIWLRENVLTMRGFRPILAMFAIALGVLLWTAGRGGECGVEVSATPSACASEEFAVSADDGDSHIASAFKASTQMGLVSLTNTSVASTPAHVHAQRRTFPSLRNSLGRTLAEHFGSTVMACRFGLLDFKHIIFFNHSFLLLIAVLII